MNKIIGAIILTILALALLYLGGPAHAQTLTPFKAVAKAKQTGRLPIWLTVDDSMRFPTLGDRIYGCYIDRTTGAYHAAWAPLSAQVAFLQRGTWTFSAPEDTGTGAWQVCWPSPQVIGDPVYNFIAYTAGPGSPLKWGVMDQQGVARQTLTGETCGVKLDWIPSEHEDPKVAWYTISDGGMTRCLAP